MEGEPPEERDATDGPLRAESPDQTVLTNLLANVDSIRVQAAHSSFNVSHAARALHSSHPRYCFLTDRDHRFNFNSGRDHDAEVEKTWQSFAHPECTNLLIWRRREIENYFLIPDYLARSRYRKCTKQELARRITEVCGERVYLDAANLVIVTLGVELRKEWIKKFPNNATQTQAFSSFDDALKSLLSREEIKSRAACTSEILAPKRIEQIFQGFVGRMLDGSDTPVLGRGDWLEMVQGSRVFPDVVNSCFHVVNLQDKVLQGPDARNAIFKELPSLPLSDQPEDFQELHRLMAEQVRRRK